MDEKMYFIEFRTCEGSIQTSFMGKDFVPNTPIHEWPTFRVISSNKNEAIDEMIAKLNSLKDK
jgi:hypothetical protein